MPSLHKKGKGGVYYAVFKDVTEQPKEKWVPLKVTLKSAAILGNSFFIPPIFPPRFHLPALFCIFRHGGTKGKRPKIGANGLF